MVMSMLHSVGSSRSRRVECPFLRQLTIELLKRGFDSRDEVSFVDVHGDEE
jgi:hypothetical protein